MAHVFSYIKKPISPCIWGGVGSEGLRSLKTELRGQSWWGPGLCPCFLEKLPLTSWHHSLSPQGSVLLVPRNREHESFCYMLGFAVSDLCKTPGTGLRWRFQSRGRPSALRTGSRERWQNWNWEFTWPRSSPPGIFR